MKYPVLAGLLLALSACGGGDSHGTSTDPNGATGFITANTDVPDTARSHEERGDPIDADGRPYTYKYLGQALPEFSGNTLGGGSFSSTSMTQWTVIDVWGIWCGDCMADAPHMAELAARIARDDDLDFISIHTPPSPARVDEAYGKFGSVDAYFNAKGYSYRTVLDTDASLRGQLGIGWTPSYLLVSPDGVVRGYRTDLSVAGDTPVDDFLRDIETVRAKHADIQAPVRRASIGPDGAGGISGVTEFSVQAIEAAFPGHRVVSDKEMAEGDAYPVFNVFGETDLETPSFTVWPNWDRGHVGFVMTRHEGVAGPEGVSIGKLRFAELGSDLRENCFPGAEDYGAALICNTGTNRQFQYIFSPARGDEVALRDAGPDVRARAILSEFRYLPPTPETN